MKERLIPVRSKSEIRIGAIHILKECRPCGATNRGILVRLTREFKCSHCGIQQESYKLLPGHCCLTHFSLCLAFREGRLFRVEDGLDPEKDNAEWLQDYAKAGIRALERAK
jgi:hypothetical protein